MECRRRTGIGRLSRLKANVNRLDKCIKGNEIVFFVYNGPAVSLVHQSMD